MRHTSKMQRRYQRQGKLVDKRRRITAKYTIRLEDDTTLSLSFTGRHLPNLPRSQQLSLMRWGVKHAAHAALDALTAEPNTQDTPDTAGM